MRPLLVLAGLLACTPSSAPDAAGTAPTKVAEPTPTAPPAAPPVTAECAAKVAAMRALFAQAPSSPVVINTPPGVELPTTTSAGGPITDGTPLFVSAAGEFELYTQRYPSITAVQQALAEEFDMARTLAERQGQPFAPALLLVADARAPASAIGKLAAALPPETRFVLIANLAGDTVPTPPPTPESVRAVLADTPVEVRSQELANVIAPALGTCKAARDAFGAVADTTADQRSKVLFDRLPTAVETCRCEGLDVETLTAAVWGMTGKFEPDKRALPLALTRDPKAEAAKLPANATVADLTRLAETRGDAPFRLAP